MNKALILIFVCVTGCSNPDLKGIRYAQAEYVCEGKGGPLKDYTGNPDLHYTTVQCIDGTYQRFAGVELPEDRWVNHE